MATPKIEVYTKDYCPYCDKAKLLLTQLGFSYSEIDLSKHPEQLEELRKRNPSARTVPQIFINGTPVGGCDDLYALHAKGELFALVNNKQD